MHRKTSIERDWLHSKTRNESDWPCPVLYYKIWNFSNLTAKFKLRFTPLSTKVWLSSESDLSGFRVTQSLLRYQKSDPDFPPFLQVAPIVIKCPNIKSRRSLRNICSQISSATNELGSDEFYITFRLWAVNTQLLKSWKQGICAWLAAVGSKADAGI